MDSEYISKKDADSFDRKTYVSIINGAALNEQPEQTRKYTTIDLFPTTLAAMEVQIEGVSTWTWCESIFGRTNAIRAVWGRVFGSRIPEGFQIISTKIVIWKRIGRNLPRTQYLQMV